MNGLDPAVRKETAYIAAWTLALSLVMEAVFLLLGKWDIMVLAGNVIGALVAVGNFWLMAIAVTKAANGPKEKIALRVRSSLALRMLGMAAICALSVGLLKTNVYATLIPLLFPRIGIAFRPMIDRKRGKTETEQSEGSELLD